MREDLRIAGLTNYRVMVVLTSLARTSGGGRTFMRGLSEALKPDLCDPIYVVPRGHASDIPHRDSSCSVVEVAPLRGLTRVLRDLVFCSRWARMNHADVVVVPHEWAPRAGVPVVNVIQNVLYLKQGPASKSVKSTAMRWIIRKTMQNAGGTVSVANTTRDIWAQFSGRCSDVIPEGVDQIFFNSATSNREKSIVIITGPAEYKNPRLSQEVARRLSRITSDIKIVIVGLDSSAYVDNVQCIPWMRQSDLARLLGTVRIVLFPSTIESFGLPAFEARAAGARVAVLEGTPMAEWLSGDPFTSIVGPAHDAQQIASQLLATLEDHSDATSSTKFHWDSVGPMWLSYILGVAHGA